MNAKIYSHEGAEVGNISLPEAVFGVAWNADLVHEVVIGMQANARESTAHTKGRGDVRGGVSHGPRNEKDYSVKINKKVRAKALAVVLSKKFVDAEVIFVDSLSITEPKTAKGKLVLNALAKGTGQTSLATKRKNTALVVLPNRSEAIEKSFRNFGNIEVMQAKDINPVDLLTYKYVVVADPTSSLEVFSKRVSVTAAAPKK